MTKARNNPNLPQPEERSGASGTEATIEAPEIKQNGMLDLKGLSVRDHKHALNICNTLEQLNRRRSARCAAIQAWYDGQAPRSADMAAQRGQNWQSNFTSRHLAGLVDPAVMRAVQSINGQVYITKSTLPHHFADWKSKSDTFQSVTTRLIRSWDGFSSFLGKVAQENFLHGYAFAVWMDAETWKPTFYKQEDFFVQDKATQEVNKLQCFCARHDYQLHEFLELFMDSEAAELAGYDIENCIFSANHATIDSPHSDAYINNFRKFEDMIAEGTLGLTYTGAAGARIVKTWMLWNKEYDGKVSFWIIDRDSGKLLRYVNRAFDKMSEVLSLFTLEPANGTIHSSNGIGRKVIGLSVATEKSRNAMVDQAVMASVTMLKMPAKDRSKFAPVQMGPFTVFDSTIEVIQDKPAANTSMYADLDMRMQGWAQQATGSYITAMLRNDGKDKTATQSAIDNQREQEQGDAVRSRWVDQFCKLVNQMQVRAYSDEAIKQAKNLFDESTSNPEYKAPTEDEVGPEVLALLELFTFGLEESDIKYLRKAPASGLATVEDALSGRGIAAVVQVYSGNPNVNQTELIKRNIEQMAGPEAAKTLVIQDVDQTVAAEAIRAQLLEASTMLNLGVPVPVSSRDNHMVHAATLKQVIQATFPELSQNPTPNPKLMKAIELGLNHLAGHLAAAHAAGIKTPELAELDSFHAKTLADVKNVVQIQANAAVGSQVGAAVGAQVAQGAAAQAQNTPPEAPAAQPEQPVDVTAPVNTNQQ